MLPGGAPAGGTLKEEAWVLARVSYHFVKAIFGNFKGSLGLATWNLGTYGSGLTIVGNESSKGFSTKAILTCSLKGI